MLSEWASQAYQKVYKVDVDRCYVLKNAVAPPFERLFPAGASVLAHKKPHAMVYTSAPFRGLSVLLDAWPTIRAACPDATVQVFSGMGTYQITAEKDAFADLYERCRTTDGIDYRGPVPQPELAVALREAAVLAYPCIFDETSCISVMEAMAAGCAIVTTQRGALPETTGGFARLVPSGDRWRQLVAPFAAATIKTLAELDTRPAAMEAHLQAQVGWMRTTGTWAERARDWETTMLRLVALKRGVA
jgi:glycosyltransferase involved in cell wall biosynthesis